MTGPLLVDVDLRDARPPLLRTQRPVLALLWWGDRVLGAQRIPGDRKWAETHAELLQRVRPVVAALDSMETAPTHAGATPAEVTVVVCTRERPRYLADCLAALARLDPGPAEIVVVDNAPETRSTADLTERHGVRRVVEDRPGLSYGRNAGWRAATSRVVAYTDDDARPHAGWIAALCRGFADPGVACVTGLVAPAELMTPAQRLFESNGGMGKGYWPGQFTAERVGFQVYRLGVGANMAFTRAALEAIGGFDVRLGPGRPTRGADDLDAFLRVLASGGTAVYQPDAVVRHVHRRDLRGLMHQYRDNGAGYAALLRKHELLGGPLGDAAAQERRRWRRQRHGRRMLSAVARRNLRQLIELVPEIVGSRRGADAFDQEARQLARGVHGR